jgi:hypothetical protein
LGIRNLGDYEPAAEKKYEEFRVIGLHNQIKAVSFASQFRETPFEKAKLRKDSVAQLVEQYTFNVWVLGSNPSGITKFFFPKKSFYCQFS